MQPRDAERCFKGVGTLEHCLGKVNVTGQGTDWEGGEGERGWSGGMSGLLAWMGMGAFPTEVETREWEPWGW